MRHSLAAAALAVTIGLSGAACMNRAPPVGGGMAAAPGATDPAAFPPQLYDAQLQLVRQARMSCEVSSPTRAAYQGCMMSTVEGLVRSSDDPGLQALNARLPFNWRYDPNRLQRQPSHLLQSPIPG